MTGGRGALVVSALSLLAAFGFATEAGAHTAYVVDRDDDAVIPFDTVSGAVGEPIQVGNEPFSIAITPDGTRAYVTNMSSHSVSVIDTSSNSVVATITVGDSPQWVAIAPDGETAYVTNNGSGSVSVIDTHSNTVIGELAADSDPAGVAVTPDGRAAYVSADDGTVRVIDLEDGSTLRTMVGLQRPLGIAFAPDGGTAYVAAVQGNYVAVINTQDGFANPISVGSQPIMTAVTPDGKTAYVANWLGPSVSVIDTSSNAVVETIPVPLAPVDIAITPDGKTAYVYSGRAGTLTPIDTATNEALEPIEVADPGSLHVAGVAITPNQSPAAELAADPLEVYVGEPVSFEVGPPTDDMGIESAHLSFGDGTSATPEGGGTYKHLYSEPGSYEASLTVDDGEGCEPLPQFFPPLASPFTGQTAHCNGPSRVTSSVRIEVRKAPRLRLRLGVKRPQRSLRQVRLRATCEGIECQIRAQVKLGIRWPGAKRRTFRLDPATKSLRADRPTALRLEIPSEARGVARKALRRGGKVWARVRVAASAPGKQRRVQVKRVRIAPR